MTGVFEPTYSTNNIWWDEEFDQCLTLHLEEMKGDITALETGKANTSHTHIGYVSQSDLDSLEAVVNTKANTSHTHTGYATTSHTHSEYASSSHTHDGYALTSHTHTSYAASSHTHTASAIGAVATSDIATISEVETYLGI